MPQLIFTGCLPICIHQFFLVVAHLLSRIRSSISIKWVDSPANPWTGSDWHKPNCLCRPLVKSNPQGCGVSLRHNQSMPDNQSVTWLVQAQPTMVEREVLPLPGWERGRLLGQLQSPERRNEQTTERWHHIEVASGFSLDREHPVSASLPSRRFWHMSYILLCISPFESEFHLSLFQIICYF